jgi:NTE family protein
MDIGLVLEGGGARGAYQIGAVKCLVEKGYNIKGVVGTSIGAINGAMVALNKIDECYDIWKNMSHSTLFDVQEDKISSVFKKEINLSLVKYMTGRISNLIKNGGINTDKMKQVLSKYIIEDNIRNSKIDYGLVTFCLSDRKPIQLFKEEIPKGMLNEYIMSSARLPGFKQELVDGKYYIDGGVYNNCPVDMLIDKGYKDIFIIRLKYPFGDSKFKESLNLKDVNITTISPKINMPSILDFDNIKSNKLLLLGYYDTLKILDGLDGINYYCNYVPEEKIFKMFSELELNEVNKIYKMLDIKSEISRKVFFEQIIPLLMRRLGVKYYSTYKEVMFTFIEYAAKELNIDEFKVYNFDELLNLVKNKISCSNDIKIDKVILEILKNI